MPNDNLSKKNPNFVVESEAKIKRQTQEQQQQRAETVNKVKKLIADMKTADRNIQGIEILKKSNQSASNLAIIEEEIKKSHDDKLILVTKLSEIRGLLNSEFNKNFERLQKKETELEEGIKDTYGDIGKYIPLKSELYNTRNEHINLIQKNLDSEQALFEISREDLKSEIEKKLFTLHQTELNLQHKIQKYLRDEKETIERNFELHSKETIEFKQYLENYTKIIDTLVPCEDRISILNDKIDIQQKAQSEEGELVAKEEKNGPSELYEVNSFYEGQEQIQQTRNVPPVVDRSKKPKEYLQSDPQVPSEPTSPGRGLNFGALLETRKQVSFEVGRAQPEKQPSRLAESSFFSSPSSSSNQDAKEKEKISNKGFASRQ